MKDRWIGHKLGGRYEVLSVLGQGGMGTVYMASYGRMRRRVAVKVIPESLLKNDEARVRFNQETWAAAQLDHPNIVKALDAGVEADGTPWLAMEYLRGRNLRELLRLEGPLAWPRTIPMIEDALRGLAAAHDRGLVHRDLKPENLFLLDDGRPCSVKVVDFGIVKTVSATSSNGLTQAGSFLGTPSYAAPELIRGEPEPATDLYALAATWFELMVGHPPYGRGEPIQTLWKHLDEQPPRPTHVRPELGLPFGLEELLMQMLEKDPLRRPASANDVLDMLADRGAGYSTQPAFMIDETREAAWDAPAMIAPDAAFAPLFGPTGTAVVSPMWEEKSPPPPTDSGEIPAR